MTGKQFLLPEADAFIRRHSINNLLAARAAISSGSIAGDENAAEANLLFWASAVVALYNYYDIAANLARRKAVDIDLFISQHGFVMLRTDEIIRPHFGPTFFPDGMDLAAYDELIRKAMHHRARLSPPAA